MTSEVEVVAGRFGAAPQSPQEQPAWRPYFNSASTAFLDDWLAAGHRNRRTGNITRFLRCEHDIDRRELARLGWSFHGDLLAEMRDGFDGHRRRDQRRPDRPRRDCIGPDTLLSQKLGQPSGEILNRSFCGGVCQEMRTGSISVHRCRVDDGRAFGHVRDC